MSKLLALVIPIALALLALTGVLVRLSSRARRSESGSAASAPSYPAFELLMQ